MHIAVDHWASNRDGKYSLHELEAKWPPSFSIDSGMEILIGKFRWPPAVLLVCNPSFKYKSPSPWVHALPCAEQALCGVPTSNLSGFVSLTWNRQR